MEGEWREGEREGVEKVRKEGGRESMAINTAHISKHSQPRNMPHNHASLSRYTMYVHNYTYMVLENPVVPHAVCATPL